MVNFFQKILTEIRAQREVFKTIWQLQGQRFSCCTRTLQCWAGQLCSSASPCAVCSHPGGIAAPARASHVHTPHTHPVCAVCAFQNLRFRHGLVHSIVRAEVGSSDCSLKPKCAKEAVIHKYCQKTLTVIKNYFRYTKNSRVSVITLSRFALENLVFLSKAYSFVFDCSLSLPFQPYYNHHILSLLQPLVTSGTSRALGEQPLKEGSRLRTSPDNVIHNASQVTQTAAPATVREVVNGCHGEFHHWAVLHGRGLHPCCCFFWIGISKFSFFQSNLTV